MRFRFAKVIVIAAMLALMPMSSASAGGRWGHGGPWGGIFGLGAAVAIGTAAMLTAPIAALAATPQQEYYAPPQAYAAQPYRYAPPPAYYAPPGYYR